ncbi:MAG: hypothetical protein V3U20_04110 [Thermoplasmata archaeon]
MRKKSKRKEADVVFQVAPQEVQSPQTPVQQPMPAEQPLQFQPDIPMAQPVEKSKGKEFQCPECGKIFIVALTKRPAHIKCPYCGLEGMID